MSSTGVPKKSADFFVEEMDDECLLYKVGTHTAIHLNETATLIWKLSDGTRGVGDIAAWMAEQFPDRADDVAADVEEAVGSLVEAGALTLSA